jgi:outer membrane protein assembly factor BamB
MTTIVCRLILTLCLAAGLQQSVCPAWAQSSEKRSTTTDWSSFRGPTGQGIADVADLPLQWSATDNIAWKAEMPGPGASSPVVFDEHIYVTAYSGFFVPDKPGGSQDDLKRHLLCFDRRSGKQLWEQVVPAKLPEEESIRDHGFAASTPAVGQDHVYCFFGKTGVFAFDHAGKQVWRADVGSKTHGWGSAASPVLHEDLVIINASVESESLVALNRVSGKVVWKADNIKEAWNTPAVVRNSKGQLELVVATQGQIRSFEPLTGKPLWTCATDITWYMVPSLVANDGVVYSLGGRSGVAALAVRTGGNGDVTQTHRLWTGQRGSNVTSPVFYDGHLYFMNDNREIAYCLNAATGEALYEKRINRSGQIYASALLAGDRIYYLSRDGRTFVVAADPEFKELATNDLRDGSLFNGSFAVDGSRLLVRSDRYLYAIGE